MNFCWIVFLSFYFQQILTAKQARNPRSCYAELKCGGILFQFDFVSSAKFHLFFFRFRKKWKLIDFCSRSSWFTRTWRTTRWKLRNYSWSIEFVLIHRISLRFTWTCRTSWFNRTTRSRWHHRTATVILRWIETFIHHEKYRCNSSALERQRISECARRC